MLHERLTELLPARQGHFLLESGHHSSLWLDLELLFLRPLAIQPLARELAQRLSAYPIEAVCGPLVEGAFVAQLVAAELDLAFCYTERVVQPLRDGLYPVDYRIPAALRPTVQGKAVAIVNDVINAGSAVRGTFADLRHCGAEPVAIGSLLVLGDWAPRFAAEEAIALESIAALPNDIWPPAACPLCTAGVPLNGGAGAVPPAVW